MKITEKELLSIVSSLLKDELIAKVEEVNNECVITFSQGEKFTVQVQKIN